eukprot:UN08120
MPSQERRRDRRSRRRERRAYPVANKLPSNRSMDIVPSKRSAPPTKEPKHKRVRRNQIGPPLDVDEDNMEEEEKRQEIIPPQNRKRKLDTLEMDVSPIVSNVPKINND